MSSSIHSKPSASTHDTPFFPRPISRSTNPSPSSSRASKRASRTTKLKRHSAQRSKSRSSRQETTPTPSIASTTSSFSEVKHVFSSWIGNIRAGVTGAWTKAKGEADTYLATQEGESRMQRRRQEILDLSESNVVAREVEDEVGGKRPATSDGATLPALKKRSLNTKKLKKQKSLGKLGFRKSSISYPTPNTTATLPSATRPPPAPVYRATTGFVEHDSDDGLRTRVQSLETELSSLRAKLRWFEQSYGEIPAETLVGISNSVTESPKKQRRSVFKEELGSMNGRNGVDMSIGDQSILPRDVKSLKGYDNIDPITEESDSEEMTRTIPPESTIKLIPPSPSTKSLTSPPRQSRISTSPSKFQSPLSSPTRLQISPISSPSKGVQVSPMSSPTKLPTLSSPIDVNKPVDLLETLSPIHPNIIPALVPRPSRPDLSKENMRSKLSDIAD